MARAIDADLHTPQSDKGLASQTDGHFQPQKTTLPPCKGDSEEECWVITRGMRFGHSADKGDSMIHPAMSPKSPAGGSIFNLSVFYFFSGRDSALCVVSLRLG